MGADDHILITLSGEGPWGFRLQGGSEKSLPLLVSKVRKRSKACRGGLRENDELVSINGKACAGLSHAEAMLMIDSSSGSSLHIRVKRAAAGAQTVPRSHRVLPSPGSPNSIRIQDPPSSWVASSSSSTPGQPKLLHLESITSPPDSEAYYGETDSDADIRSSSGHPQSTQQHHSQQQAPPEKHRRTRKKSPRSPPGNNNKAENEQQSLSEMSGYESGPGGVTECVVQSTGGVAKREITYQPGGSRAETPFSDVEGFLPAEEEQQMSITGPSPESLLLPHATKTIKAERHLIPMIGPVEHPVDDDLTTTYLEKAREAKLHRSESVQEKNVKEARTKCRTIASLLTDAPNPHSKGVLMFKKRRQRAKKYTLVSYGSVDEDRYIEDEEGVFPTSESEFDEEGFSDARSLTNHSDWDSTYLDIEKPKMEHEQQEEKGLSEASGKGAALFEMQRQRSEQFSVDNAPPQNPQENHKPTPIPPQRRSSSGNARNVEHRSQEISGSESPKVASTNISLSPPQPTQPGTSDGTGIFNRSARPFTPGQVGQRSMASSVIFNPITPKKVSECSSVPNVAPSPFAHFSHAIPSSPAIPLSPQRVPGGAITSLYIPAPVKPAVSSTPPDVGGEKDLQNSPTFVTPRTTTASIYLSSPSRPSEPQTVTSQPNITKLVGPTTVTPLTPPVSQLFSPASSVQHDTPSYTPVSLANTSSESVTSREQKISVPFGRTGILNEARKRGGRKQMFAKVEEKKCLPNPDLMSMVQNLDEKPKQDQPGAGFESGPEEDFLSLGAEACNFMQSAGRKLKVPPPVAPKPYLKADELVNGTHDMPQLKGKGAELFAKRQSRMDKFVVESTPRSSSRPNSRPRTPSPTPSLPSSWKYSSNIRAPPPIAYNPLYSPFYPLAACKSQPVKADSKVKKTPANKPRMQAIDFMRHQPYQLNSAMFCFGDSSNTANQTQSSQNTTKSSLPSTPARQVPVKTVRAHDIKRFSTPTPMSSSANMKPTVLAPRSATTLAEPVWRTEMSTQHVPSTPTVPMPYQPPTQDSVQNSTTSYNRASAVFSPTSFITSPRASVSRIQVPKPKFCASKTGMQANVWRPAKIRY
ncbi:synaptopodin 2-like protein [Pelobates fuscus]|uniref:synaptopodin 2-like protein n=1 Tax=Pelobates fuscus TaxID=191477 RepID=UPI002FE4941E